MILSRDVNRAGPNAGRAGPYIAGPGRAGPCRAERFLNLIEIRAGNL